MISKYSCEIVECQLAAEHLIHGFDINIVNACVSSDLYDLNSLTFIWK